MSQQLQDLIEKIKREGILEAEEQRKKLENQARERSDAIIKQAHAQAEVIIADAKAQQQKIEEVSRAALKQACRDMMLSLRKEIEAVLGRIVTHNVGRALSPEELTGIIKEAVSGYFKKNSAQGDLVVMLNADDLKKLKDGFLAELKDQVKTAVTLKPAQGLGAGFTISFDGGRSLFDFSDESLAQYMSGYLNAALGEILKGSVKG